MGKFEGLADMSGLLSKPLIPYPWTATKHGQRPLHPRKILNTLIWALTTGARWCDVPVGPQWASRAWAHKYLGSWKENGVLERALVTLQQVCIDGKMIDLHRLSVDGFFSGEKEAVRVWTMGTREKE